MKKQRWRFTKKKTVTCVECEKQILVSCSHEGIYTLCSAKCYQALVGEDWSNIL